jgi:NADH dehydrogenase
MQVLVVGASGVLGEAIVRELRACAYTVRAMVRSGKALAHLHDYGATLEFGNLDDPASLPRACYGAQALIIALPGEPFAYRRGSERYSVGAVRNLIGAACKAGIGQVVLASALAADQASGAPALLHRHLGEAYLRGSGLPFTLLRPAALQEWFGERYPLKPLIERLRIGPLPGRGFGRHSFVAAADVARAARLALERPEARDVIVEVGGPEILSFHEAYRRISCALGQSIRPIPLLEPVVRGAGLLARPLLPELRLARGLGPYFDGHDYIADTPAWLVELLGPRRSFDTFVATTYGTKAQHPPVTVA